jgi:hypothetical protein
MGKGIFAVLDQAGELIGELSIEFYDEKENPLLIYHGRQK